MLGYGVHEHWYLAVQVKLYDDEEYGIMYIEILLDWSYSVRGWCLFSLLQSLSFSFHVQFVVVDECRSIIIGSYGGKNSKWSLVRYM
jgi:hypothetical protein